MMNALKRLDFSTTIASIEDYIMEVFGVMGHLPHEGSDKRMEHESTARREIFPKHFVNNSEAVFTCSLKVFTSTIKHEWENLKRNDPK